MSDVYRDNLSGSLIVVGDPDLAEHLATVSERPVHAVPNFAEALGSLVIAASDEMPEAIIGSLWSLPEDSDELAQAFRRIHEPILLLLAGDRGDATVPELVKSRRFDGMVEAPCSQETLERALAEARAKRPAAARVATNGHSVPAEEADSSYAEAPEPPVVEVVPRVPGMAEPAQRAEQRSAPATGPAIAATPSEEAMRRLVMEAIESAEVDADRISAAAGDDDLGDIDLIEALMNRPCEFPALALQVLGAHCGTTDVALVRGAGASGDAVPVVHGGMTLGRLESRMIAPEALRPWAEWLGRWLGAHEQLKSLRAMAFRDHLTGAWNRRFFDAYLDEVIARARQARLTVSLLLFDIDDFKIFNDRFGHSAGDRILVETVRLLGSVIRPTDKVCRIGGDEFCVVFYDPQGERKLRSRPPQDVHAVAKRFQEQISAHRFRDLGPDAPARLTISGGLATFPWDAGDRASLLEHADRAARHAKEAGKNAVRLGPGVSDEHPVDR